MMHFQHFSSAIPLASRHSSLKWRYPICTGSSFMNATHSTAEAENTLHAKTEVQKPK